MNIRSDSPETLKALYIKRVWWPILFGLAGVVFLFCRSKQVSIETFSLLLSPNWYYAVAASFCIVLRELGHVVRLRILSNHSLKWISCFYAAVFWEFATAVSPSVIGGGVAAIFVLSKEGLSLGRSLAYVIVNGILDNLFFLCVGAFAFNRSYEDLFTLIGVARSGAKVVFFTNYMIILCYTLVIAFSVFLNPRLLEYILMRVTSIAFFKRWRQAACRLSKDIILTAHEFKGRSGAFWSTMLLCTIVTWLIRYAFLNCLVATYMPVTLGEHLTLVGKQVIMWSLMLVPISPGGSGVAELLFKQFFESMLKEYTLPLALLWRLSTFYLYLILGMVFLPKWIRKVFMHPN